MSVEDSVEEVLAAVPPPLRAIVDALRNQVMALHPDAIVLAWPKQKIISFGIGPRKMSEHYAYIGVQTRHVNLGFYFGTALADPHSLLEGTGQNLRHVKLGAADQAGSPQLRALLEEAIRQIGSPVAPAA